MNVKQSAIAFAITAALPLAAQAAPKVSFVAPASGGSISGVINQSSACEVRGSSDIRRVVFYIDGRQLNTEGSAPWNCNIDTRQFADGSHTLRAVAYDSRGASTATQIGVNIANNTTSTSGPTVQFTAPAEGGALSGNVQGPPSCVVTGTNIARVMFYLNDQWTNTDGNLSNGLGCWIDTTKYQDGAYTVKAVAYDAAGKTATATRSIVIKNAPAVNASPTVSFKAPTAGSTIMGLVNSTTCEAAAADSDGSVSKVDFYVGSTFVNSKSAAPWQCAIDTTKFPDGSHTLMAVATDNLGAAASTQVGVTIQNATSGGGGSTGTAISAADIVYAASANLPFSQQSGYTAQVIGTYTSAPSIPESGIHGTVLANGESLRLGKSADPVDSARKALTFQLSPSDPNTSGSKRSEISFSPKIEHDKVYWVALSAYVHDWGTLSSSDSSVFGTQLHSGDNSRGLSPAFSIISNGGKDFQIYALYSTSSSPAQGNTTTTRSPRFALPFERWVDFVFKFRLNTSGQGFLQVWQDGTQIVDYKGSLGFNTPGYKDYMKFGYYNWSSALNSPRKVQLRSPVTVADPTGSKYKPEDLRGYLKAQP